MTPPTTDFIVVVSNDDDFHAGFHQFSDKVNRKLKAGYKLHGQPFSINQKLVCQAMIREGGPLPAAGDPGMTFNQPDVVHLA